MLKAVRFDPETHKELIDYIENYRDKRGKPNHSEAIRLLMEKGFENLHNPIVETKVIVQQAPSVDLDKVKEDILKEVWSTIGKNILTQPVQTHTFTPVNPAPIQIEEVKKEPVSKPAPPKPSNPPVAASGLLGNLLGNSNR